jgi:Domain of unknown function (DUF4189)
MHFRSIAFFSLGALLLAPTPASAEFDNTVPWRNLSANAPLVVTRTSTWFNGDGTIRLCVNFRNVSNKAASRARITFEFDDSFDRPLRDAVLERSGSFGPGVLIEGKMDLLGGNSDSFNNCVDRVAGTSIKPTIEKIDVTDVIFEDGTRWKKGDPFVRAFDNGGGRVIAPAPGASAAPAGSAPVVTIGGATGTGGVVGPAGSLFGTIAWVAGSRTAYGVTVDAQSQDEADFAAMTACTKLNGGNSGCKPVARMTGSDKKCAAIATDTTHIAISQGPDLSSTIQTVLAVLAKEGGTIEANSIVTSKCNSH